VARWPHLIGDTLSLGDSPLSLAGLPVSASEFYEIAFDFGFNQIDLERFVLTGFQLL